MIISFEGIDGCGKTTQIANLSNWLKEMKILHTVIREPGGTPLGEEMREILERKYGEIDRISSFLLFIISRREATKKIQELLQKNHWIIMDRFIDSTTVLQGYIQKIDLNLIQYLNSFVTENILPDITFIFDISLTELIKRKKASNQIEKHFESRNNEIISGFKKIAIENPERCKIIDANRTKEEIASNIIKIIKKTNAFRTK